MRALAIVAKERSPALPDVPTFVESGFKDIDQTIWWGLMAPGKTPDSIVSTLHAALEKALVDPEIVKKLQSSGYDVIASTPAEMARRYRADYELLERSLPTPESRQINKYRMEQ